MEEQKKQAYSNEQGIAKGDNMRAFVDKDTCISCGLCASLAPDVFRMDEEDKAEAFTDTDAGNQDSVDEAIASCPVEAIREQE